MSKKPQLTNMGRHFVVLGVMVIGVAFLIWRVVDLQIMNKDFLQGQGDARHLRTLTLAAHRGIITDRNGEPLAISTPVDSVWANPQELMLVRDKWSELARFLSMDVDVIQRRLTQRSDREFVYLKRHINPDHARQIRALNIPGVYLQREYRRYYPAGEVTAHVVGFTNVDDVGQEGLELAFDKWLRGSPGSKRVIKDRLGNVIEDVESIKQPAAGNDLMLSIDRRIQYLAYRELKAAVQTHNARSGSAVILDVQTGEVLAMVNQPSYNPNNRFTLRSENFRNRSVTDVFEPGSAIKPFTIAAALETGKYKPHTFIDTSPGYFKVGKYTIRDIRNFGAIDVSTVIQKSSNVGASKIALAIEPQHLWEIFSKVGYGSLTGSGFPGEVSGLLTSHWRWREVERATLSFGYGISVTPLQLAQSYRILADQGNMRPVTFLARDASSDEIDEGESVISQKVAEQIIAMMERVVDKDGTGSRARIPGYRVAGKTGTVQKSTANGYSDERYIALFAGIAPASQPRLAMVVMINEPRNKDYYGGVVAAPVFSNVMAGALRLLGIPPDDVPAQHQQASNIVVKKSQKGMAIKVAGAM